jgi:L-asparagine transporter-like permease
MRTADKDRLEKILFFVFSMLILLLIFLWALNAKDSNSPYVRFQDKIDTFR